MSPSVNQEGVFVASVTPFDDEGRIDLVAAKAHAEWLVACGVQGIVPCGTTGEGPTLSDKERAQMIEAALSAAQGKSVHVMAGCGSNDTQTSKKWIAEAEALGCDSTMLVTPYYNKPTQAGILAHYLHLADSATKPVVLYHVPGRTNVHLALETIAKLFEHPRIAGIKEASGQYSFWLGLAALAREQGKILYAGDDDAYAVIQALGGRGIISACANVVPEPFVQMHAWMKAGEWEKAFALQMRLAPLVRAFFCETSPSPIKYALHRYRRMRNHVRLPLVRLSTAGERAVIREWERFQEQGV